MAITPGWETVILTVDPSGFVEARIGSSPHGQGLRTTLAQIIADEIGVTPDVIKIVHGKGLQNGQPLIKTCVNGWLRQIPQVLAFVSALPRDGGTGAAYVLLKKTAPPRNPE